jgi:serine/threonine protein phosphatase PrpC
MELKDEADGRSTEERWTSDCEILGATLPEPGHELDSDDYGWAPLRPGTDRDPLLLAVVCDGVGSSARKREASRLAVRSMLAWAAGPPDLGEGLERALSLALKRAHDDVREQLQGAGLSTIVAALVDDEARRIAWASVGDSALYLHIAGECRKLNVEDKAARPRRRNGRTVFAVMDHGLTQALGQLEDVHPQTGDLEFVAGTLLALASDGIKEPYVPDFLREQGRLARAAEVLAFCDEMRRTDKKDDSTFVLIRLGEPEESRGIHARVEAYASASAADRDELLAELESGKAVPADWLVACLGVEADDVRSTRLIALLEASVVPLPPERWLALLDDAARAGRVAAVRRLSQSMARARTRPRTRRH